MVENIKVRSLGILRSISRILSGAFILILINLNVTWADVTASVDRNNIELNESFTLKIIVDSLIDEEPDASALEKDFIISSRSQLSNTTIINGAISRSRTWSYTLTAKRAGDFIIPSVIVGSEKSQPLDISILPQTESILWSQDHDHIPTYYHVCYKGVLPKSSNSIPFTVKTAVKEELNLLTDMKFKFTDLDEPQKGEDDNFYIFEDDEGNKYTFKDTEARCFEDRGTIINHINNEIIAIAFGWDEKLKSTYLYGLGVNYPTHLLLPVGYYFDENIGNSYCLKEMEFDNNEGEIAALTKSTNFLGLSEFKGVTEKKVINNECVITHIADNEGLTIFDSSPNKPKKYIPNDVELHAKYIPLYQACVQQDFRIENKVAAEILIKEYIENIKTAIDYGYLIRDEMNERDKEGRKLANAIKARGFYSDHSYQEIANDFLRTYDDGSLLMLAYYDDLKKIENFCARFNQLALDHQIEETEGPY